MKEATGNLLEADVEALVNTVNCVGVMGKGIALQFKQAYPDNFRAYESACKRGEVQLGRMMVFDRGRLENPRFIINFPTKGHWRSKSRLKDVETGLASLVEEVQRLGIRSMAVPPLGCGNGGLDWGQVSKLLVVWLSKLPDVDVLVYSPSGAPPAYEMKVGTTPPKMTRARALLTLLLNSYGEPWYRVTKLEIQKLAYFVQCAGEPLRLQFEKQKFGPYAENLNKALVNMEGHFIRGFGDRSSIRTELRVVAEKVPECEAFLDKDHEAHERLLRVRELIDGFETPYGLELLSTVHWMAWELRDQGCDFDSVFDGVVAWNDRKAKIFQHKHVLNAWQRLQELGWLPDAARSESRPLAAT